VSEREYAWTDAGKLSADQNGVTQAEVIQALYSPRQFTHLLGTDVLTVFGQTELGHVMMVLVVRYAEGVNTFLINGVREATDAELEEWKRRAT
jgi:hypothetical protein